MQFDVWRLLSDYATSKCSLAELLEFDASLPSKVRQPSLLLCVALCQGNQASFGINQSSYMTNNKSHLATQEGIFLVPPPRQNRYQSAHF